jgi:hypothetical protein
MISNPQSTSKSPLAARSKTGESRPPNEIRFPVICGARLLAIGRLVTHSAVLVVTLSVGAAGQDAATPRLRLELDEQRPQASWLSWDTEKGSRADTKSIARRQCIRPACADRWQVASGFGFAHAG